MRRATHRDVVIEEKEDPEDKSKRKRQCDPLPIELPEMYEPGTPVRGLKCCAHGERLRTRTVETTPVCHSRGCDKSQRHAVIGTEPADVPVEQRGARKELEEEGGDKHQEGENERDESAGWGRSCVLKLVRENLNAILDVGPGDVEAKGIAGKDGNVLQEVAP